MKEKFHEKAFDKIAADKRERIMNVAIHEFSTKGYNAASINIIARKAEVSIGGMYRYFKSKEALFMTILDWGYEILEEALMRVFHMEGDLFSLICNIVSKDFLFISNIIFTADLFPLFRKKYRKNIIKRSPCSRIVYLYNIAIRLTIHVL